MSSITRLAIVVSHPIQHFVHLYRALAEVEGLRVRVFFCSKIGLKPYHDSEMKQTIQWAGDLTAGYDHEFLPEADGIQEATVWVNNPSISGALAAFGPDVVMLYGYSMVTQLRALAWCRMHSVPTLMVSDNEELHSRPRNRKLARRLVLPLVLRQYSGFLTVGDRNEAFYAKYGVGRDRLYRSPFPIDEGTYLRVRANRPGVRARVREEFGIREDTFVFVTVGKLTPRKRALDAVDALAQLPKTTRACRLVLCGDGEDRAAIEARILQDKLPITLAGFVNVDKLPDLYAAADAFVLMSEHDPHPLVCIEAAAMGLPMILSDRIGAVGPSDIARREENALIFPCGDPAGLAGCMVRLLQDDALTQNMADASTRIYAECNMATSVAGVVRAVTREVEKHGRARRG